MRLKAPLIIVGLLASLATYASLTKRDVTKQLQATWSDKIFTLEVESAGAGLLRVAIRLPSSNVHRVAMRLVLRNDDGVAVEAPLCVQERADGALVSEFDIRPELVEGCRIELTIDAIPPLPSVGKINSIVLASCVEQE